MMTAVDALGALGLTSAELINLHPEEAFHKIAFALADLEDHAMKSAKASEIFGRQGTMLLPMLEDGAEGFAELSKKAHELGVIWDQETADSAAELTDAMGNVKTAMGGLSMEIGAILAPAATKAADALTDMLVQLNTFVRNNPALIQTIAAIAGGLVTVGGVLLTAVGGAKGLRMAFMLLFGTKIRVAIALVTSAFLFLSAKWKEVVREVLGFANTLLRGWEIWGNQMIGHTEKVINSIIGFLNTWMKRTADAVNFFGQFIPGFEKLEFKALDEVKFDRLKLELIDVEGAIEGVGNTFDDIMRKIRKALGISLPGEAGSKILEGTTFAPTLDIGGKKKYGSMVYGTAAPDIAGMSEEEKAIAIATASKQGGAGGLFDPTTVLGGGHRLHALFEAGLITAEEFAGGLAALKKLEEMATGTGAFAIDGNEVSKSLADEDDRTVGLAGE